LYSLWVICLPRDQYRQIVGQANETTIKHPMRGTGKGDSIAHNVWTACFHRPDMCGRDFCPTSSVDEFQPRDSAALVIGSQYNATEDAITQYPRHRDTNAIALLVEPEGCLLLAKALQRHFIVEPR
jgi:hypothetical protein